MMWQNELSAANPSRSTATRSTRLVLLIALLGLATSGRADTVFGVYAGAGTWQQQFSGDLSTGIANVELARDLDLKEKDNPVFYLAVEHPIPGLPNIKLQTVKFATSASGILDRSFDFNGTNFPVNAAVASRIDLTQADAVLYYQLLDNVVSLDIGVSARYLDGKIGVTSSSTSAAAAYSGVIPLLYGKARLNLPFTGAWLAVSTQAVGYGGNSLIDTSVLAGWESPLGLGMELGWRNYHLELDNAGDFNQLNIDVSGFYAAVNFHL